MATLTKQQQISIFQQGKQVDPRDTTANAFFGDGMVDVNKLDPKIAAQKNCFPSDGFLDERDTTANAFINPWTDENYAKVPEHVRKQMEQFTGSFEPSNSQALDFMQENS